MVGCGCNVCLLSLPINCGMMSHQVIDSDNGIGVDIAVKIVHIPEELVQLRIEVTWFGCRRKTDHEGLDVELIRRNSLPEFSLR